MEETMRDLTKRQWEVLQALLPAPKKLGRPRADDRCTVNGILYVLRSGIAWEKMPRRYGSYVTCWRRHSQWSADGTWQRIWQTLLGMLDETERLDWERCSIDGSNVPAKKGAT